MSDIRLFLLTFKYFHVCIMQLHIQLTFLLSTTNRIGKILNVDEEGRNLCCVVSPHQSGISNSLKSAKRMQVPIQRTILLYSTKDEQKDQSQDDCSKMVHNEPI